MARMLAAHSVAEIGGRRRARAGAGDVVAVVAAAEAGAADAILRRVAARQADVHALDVHAGGVGKVATRDSAADGAAARADAARDGLAAQRLDAHDRAQRVAALALIGARLAE